MINTHLHGDHTGGNDAFGKAGAVIIAHENVRKRLGTRAGESIHQRAHPARAREALPVVTFADSATLHFNDEDLRVHAPAERPHGDRHRGPLPQGERRAHG